jgi:excisionase family DNA binding protein
MRASGGLDVERLAYTPPEVAAAFGLSRKAIYRAIASGELQAARVCGGSRLLVPADEARSWVARNLFAPSRLRLSEETAPRRVARSTPLRDALERPAA